MAEPDDRDYQVKRAEEQPQRIHGTGHTHELQVPGHQYEHRLRDIRIKELEQENARLRKRLEEQAPPSSAPPFVKPSAKPGRRRKPGRKAGHEAALRPPPRKIDRTVRVALPEARSGRPV